MSGLKSLVMIPLEAALDVLTNTWLVKITCDSIKKNVHVQFWKSILQIIIIFFLELSSHTL